MDESLQKICPDCEADLQISVLRLAGSEDLVFQCPVCGYTALSTVDLEPGLGDIMRDLFDLVGQLNPFNLHKILGDPEVSVTDKIITTLAKLGSLVLDTRMLLMLVAFFASLFGRRRLGLVVGCAVAICMILYRDILKDRQRGVDDWL